MPARCADGVRETFKKILNGIIGADRPDGPVLHIISEPVAAMLHCNKFVTEGESTLWTSDTPILVVDVGGGTLDLTIFRWMDRAATQLAADDGSFDAGNRVDVYMLARLKERAGGEAVWDAFREYEVNPPADMPSIELNFLESGLCRSLTYTSWC